MENIIAVNIHHSTGGTELVLIRTDKDADDLEYEIEDIEEQYDEEHEDDSDSFDKSSYVTNELWKRGYKLIAYRDIDRYY